MNPPLQTPLLICYPLILLLLVSSSLKLKVDGVRSAFPPVIARPDCQATCGNVIIPFPFGVGAGCFLDPWFEIQCNGSDSKKPFLSKFNIEVMDITIPDYSNSLLQSVTVGMPFLNRCGTGATKRFGIDLRGSPYNFSTANNVFLMEGCAGSTLLFDQSNNAVLAGCSTACLHTIQ